MAQRRFLRTGQGRKHCGTHIERTVQDGVPRVVLGRKMRGVACLITGLQRKKRPRGQPKADSLKPACNVTKGPLTIELLPHGEAAVVQGQWDQIYSPPSLSIPTLLVRKVGMIRPN